jgi:hypothetical protein
MTIQITNVGTTGIIEVNGVAAAKSINVANNRNLMTATIPPSASYILTPVAMTFDFWSELR